MEMLSKFRDAASMFWDSLDTQERAILAYLAASALVSVYGRAAAASRNRLKAELREEILGRS
jgi:hypothetical protein